MKLLWVKSDFLHPTTRGGQIRTLETVKRLHQRHQVHYIALDDSANPEGLARAGEYSTRAYPVKHHVPDKRSIAFVGQLLHGLISPLPVAVNRYRSDAMKHEIERLTAREKFDAIVCDFLFPAPNMPDLSRCSLFQHNVESMIWKRHVANASSAARRWYFQMQADRMERYEGEACRTARNVIAVSENDAETMRAMYGVTRVATVPTGVDIEYFRPPGPVAVEHDLVFLGSMDWMPNIDGILWFVREVLPIIARKRPECSLAIVGRKPTPEVRRLAESSPNIVVTGTVDDVRPWLWKSHASIVPLRIGGGTRLKIYEAMAARVPVVSTAIGAEGLDVRDGSTIRIADQPEAFADACVELLSSTEARARMAEAAGTLVAERFSWDVVTRRFEELLIA